MTTWPAWTASSLAADVPVALLPVRLETRRFGDTLRIRVFPDELSVTSGGLALLPAEEQAGRDFWGGEASPEGWERLTRMVGSARAPHVARSTRPGARAELADRSPGPRARLLPDQWAILGWLGPDLVLSETRDGPTGDVRTGPEPGTQPFDARAPHLVADPELAWLTDVDAAEALGLAFSVPLPAATALDRLVVLGVRADTGGPDEGARALEDLLALHAARDRVAFVAPGTPTNAIAGQPSGYSSQPPVYDAFARVAGPQPRDDQGLSHSELARALGIGADTLRELAGADDPAFPLAGDMVRAISYATMGEVIGTMLRLLTGFTGPVAQRQQRLDAAVRDAVAFMARHVRGAGPLPSLRVGRQPYGVLPVTIVRRPGVDGPATLERLVHEVRDQLEPLVDAVPALRPGRTADVAVELRRILNRAPRPQRFTGHRVEGSEQTQITLELDEPRPPYHPWDPTTLLFYSRPTGTRSQLPRGADAGTAARLRALGDGTDPGDADLICAVLRRSRERSDGGLEHAARMLGGADLDPAAYDALFADALATVSTRLDAWFTGLAHRRLLAVRESRPTGLHLGAWGVVLDLPAAGDPATPPSAGYVHAPSLDQARTAGVLRAVEHELRGSGGTLASIDLTSDRARAARDVLDAVANGQPLGGVLGARLERRLGDAGKHLVVSDLRRRFPQRATVVGRGEPRPGAEDVIPREVVDGLAVWEGRDDAVALGLPAAILAALDADVEAVADVFVAEGVHQVVTGRDTAANATFAGLAQGVVPPLDLDVLATPASGTATVHRVLIALPPPGGGPAWPYSGNRDALAPRLEAWVASLLGPPEAITGTDADGRTRSVADLSPRCALDAVADAESIAVELGGVGSSPSLRDFVALAGAIRGVLAHARPAVPADLEAGPPSGRVLTPEESAATVATIADRLSRSVAPEESGVADRDLLRAGTAMVSRALAAAGQDDSTWGYEESVAAAAALPEGPRVLTEVVRLLAGDSALPTFALALPDDTAAAAAPPELERWLEQHGRVRDALGALDDLGLFMDVLGRDAALRPSAAQFPAGGPWVGGPLPLDPEPRNELRPRARPPGPRLHLVTVGAPLQPGLPLHALVLDEFVETVPEQTASTGLAVHYDAPSACAPQSILLAVHPGDLPTWDWETLDKIVTETLQLARLRMIDLADRDAVLASPSLHPTVRLPAAYLRPPLPDDIDVYGGFAVDGGIGGLDP